VNLNKYSAYIKLMINGIGSKPFSMQTVPPTVEHFGKGDIVRRVSRERYGRSRALIEEKIKRWSGVALTPPEEKEKKLPPLSAATLRDVTVTSPREEIKDLSALLKPPSTIQRNPSFSIVCSRCGKKADVPFEPAADRPVYCKECLQIIRSEKKSERPTPSRAAPAQWAGPKPPPLRK
jgi:CxxC-x17-CxxC domain-containing protein